MKVKVLAVLLLAALLFAEHVPGQELVVDSIQQNGQISVANVVTNTSVTIEWAPTITGRWQRTWQNLCREEPGTNVSMTMRLPRFFRAVMTSNLPPPGMVLIDGGKFLMGNSLQNSPWITLSAFYVDRYEVSNERMRQVMQYAHDAGKLTMTATNALNAHGDSEELLDLDDPDCEISYAGGTFSVATGRENFPCKEMTWYGALAYGNFKSDMDGLERCINFTNWTCDFSRNGYRLPTESEWEKASRGGRLARQYPWGSTINGSMANYVNSVDPYDNNTTPIGYYNGSQSPAGDDMANGFGLYDMAGNVWEWCWDWFGVSLPPDGSVDPTGPATGSSKILRGGSWAVSETSLRCTSATPYDPRSSANQYGFRCVRRP
ncbi:MAG: formylglycine-generating enzyme family protein [Verrucomicrobia bacterium]|nr:formylglycine-generating enzyme family protein [Verrucomicrobiota bacterium]